MYVQPRHVRRDAAASGPHYHNLAEYVCAGLAVFDEHNTDGHYDAVHKALTTLPRHKQPVFRIVDDLTRRQACAR
jgi:hypothetical protein